jgi:acetyltransferase
VQGNPVDVHGNAAPEQFADAVAALLADPGVDAIVALHVPRPGTAATDAARTVATVSRGADKPVLGAWLGAIDRHEAREALEAGGIANFFTPENAVEAFSFLAAYHRHQEWLLEVPPPQPEPEPPDLAAAEAVRAELGRAGEVELTDEHASRLLAAFGIATPPRARAATLEGVKQAARKLGYPVSLVLERNAPGTPRRERLRDARAVAHAYAALAGQAGDGSKRKDDVAVVLRKEPREDAHRDLSIGLYTDSLFGPVLAFGPRGAGERTLMLPPLNRRLAGDLVDGPRGRHAGARLLVGDEREAVIRLLLKLSTLACALPWVVEVELDPLAVIEGEVIASGVRIVADRRRAGIAGYAHMAIHPYPAELASEFVARNGVHVHIRPILPEDAQREQRFVAGLSEQTRFFRFFYRMHQLTPAMLARFTQVDYDREMALVALVDDADGVEGLSFVAVARYIENPDGISAEYAVVVADAWQAQGVGRALMERLIAVARRNGLRRLEGAVLKENVNMLKFVAGLGFSTRNDPQDGDEVITYLELA